MSQVMVMSKPRVVVCDKCQKRFNSISALNMHLRALSNNPKHGMTIVVRKKPLWRRVLRRIFLGK